MLCNTFNTVSTCHLLLGAYLSAANTILEAASALKSSSQLTMNSRSSLIIPLTLFSLISAKLSSIARLKYRFVKKLHAAVEKWVEKFLFFHIQNNSDFWVEKHPLTYIRYKMHCYHFSDHCNQHHEQQTVKYSTIKYFNPHVTLNNH